MWNKIGFQWSSRRYQTVPYIQTVHLYNGFSDLSFKKIHNNWWDNSQTMVVQYIMAAWRPLRHKVLATQRLWIKEFKGHG